MNVPFFRINTGKIWRRHSTRLLLTRFWEDFFQQRNIPAVNTWYFTIIMITFFQEKLDFYEIPKDWKKIKITNMCLPPAKSSPFHGQDYSSLRPLLYSGRNQWFWFLHTRFLQLTIYYLQKIYLCKTRNIIREKETRKIWQLTRLKVIMNDWWFDIVQIF